MTATSGDRDPIRCLRLYRTLRCDCRDEGHFDHTHLAWPRDSAVTERGNRFARQAKSERHWACRRASRLQMRAKRLAPKSEFVEPVQADFTCPDPARKIFRFSFAPKSVFP